MTSVNPPHFPTNYAHYTLRLIHQHFTEHSKKKYEEIFQRAAPLTTKPIRLARRVAARRSGARQRASRLAACSSHAAVALIMLPREDTFCKMALYPVVMRRRLVNLPMFICSEAAKGFYVTL